MKNKMWLYLILLMAYPFVAYYIINPIFGTVASEWYGMSEVLHYMIVSLGAWFIFSSKIDKKMILSIIGISMILDITKVFYSFADWLFFDSMFSKPLENFGAKDQDAIFMALAIIFWFINIVKLFWIRYKHKRLELNRIFVALGYTCILVLTTIFHIYAIEFDYLNVKKDVLAEMKLASSEDKVSFHTICRFKKWDCVYKDENVETMLNGFPPEMAKVYRDNVLTNNAPELAANFTVLQANSDDRHRYITYRVNNTWLVDKVRFKDGFDVAEKIFLSLSFCAHYFWMSFMFFLMIFHEEKIKQRKEKLALSKAN